MSDNFMQRNPVQHNKVTNRRADQLLLRVLSVVQLLSNIQSTHKFVDKKHQIADPVYSDLTISLCEPYDAVKK